MNRAQMLISLGSLLGALIIVGILFILVGAGPQNNLTIRILFTALGIVMFIVAVFGFNSLRKFQYG